LLCIILEKTAILTGKRENLLSNFDVRAYFISESREDLYRVIDQRCDEMLLIKQQQPCEEGSPLTTTTTSTTTTTTNTQQQEQHQHHEEEKEEEVFLKGLFGEVLRLLVESRLLVDTPVAKAIGYRQVKALAPLKAL